MKESTVFRAQDSSVLSAPDPSRLSPGSATVFPNSFAGSATETNPWQQTWPSSADTTGSPNETAPISSIGSSPQIYLPLTLQDAIESALSDSSIVRTLEGRVNIAEITPNDVAIAEARIDAEKGRFQPELSANFDGSKVNQPPNAFFGPGIAANNRRDVASANARITQPLPTGGSVSVGIEPPTAYLFFPDGVGAGQFNPIYSTDYVIRVKQPVLRGAGRKIALAPIRIAQTQANQSRWELEDVLNSQIRSITQGYWQLYAAHLQLHAVKSVMPLAEESVRIETLRLQADRSILADVARARVQLDGFRRTESSMQGSVRKRVLQLRQLMGERFSRQPSAHWLPLLRGADLIHQEVLNYDAYRRDPQVLARRLFEPTDLNEMGTLPTVRMPGLPAGGPGPRPPPSIGQHTRDVLKDMGLDDDAIEFLSPLPRDNLNQPEGDKP